MFSIIETRSKWTRAPLFSPELEDSFSFYLAKILSASFDRSCRTEFFTKAVLRL